MADVTKPLLDDNISVVSNDDFFLVCGAFVVYDEPTKHIALGNRKVLAHSPRRNLHGISSMFRRYTKNRHSVVSPEDIGRTVADIQKPIESTRYHTLLRRRPLLFYALDGGFEHVRRITAEEDDVIDLMQRLQEQVR